MRRPFVLFEAVGAAALGGSAVGLLELSALVFAGDPLDGLAASWAWALYGLAGMAFGALAGVVASVIARWAPAAHGVGFAGGFAAGFGGVWLTVAPYVAHRELFAERGLPPWAWAVIAALALLPTPAILSAWRARRAPAEGWKPALGVLAPWSLVAVALFAGTALQPPPAPPRSAQPGPEGPGVLIVLVDTLRADAVEDRRDLPGFGALAADSAQFASAWSPSSWTRPAIASLLTGRLPSAHRADTKAGRIAAEVPTLSEVLTGSGVPSAAVVNNPNVAASYGFARGFTQFDHLVPDLPLGANGPVFRLSLYKLVDRLDARLRGASRVSRFYQPAEVVLARSLPWLRQHHGRAHLTFVHLMEPHDPYFLHRLGPAGDVVSRDGFSRAAHPEPPVERVDDLRTRYAGEVAHVDRQLGAFLDQLRAEGLYDDLVIVLTSDHGEEFLEHGGWWHGDSLHVEQTRVPLWIKPAGARGGGGVVPGSASLLDLAPTVVARLGAPAPAAWTGRDLLAARPLTRPVPPDAGEAVAACAAARERRHGRPVVQELDFGGHRLAAVRDAGLALLLAAPGGSRGWPERQLFDTEVDPRERADLLTGADSPCDLTPAQWAERLGRGVAPPAGQPPTDAALPDLDRARLCALGYLVGEDCR
jgi:arylsulfatase A-like enzyme